MGEMRRSQTLAPLLPNGNGRVQDHPAKSWCRERCAISSRAPGLRFKGSMRRAVCPNIVDSRPQPSIDVGHEALTTTIALLCDIIIAADHAKIGDPHVNAGLVAGDDGALIWPQLIGFARAKECLFTGDLMTAAEAERHRADQPRRARRSAR
jgi:hypothetical protein